ncbi:hypothetical protein C8F01DRAFT_215211 [Mycena amicta]|nr:hypothetical protein C8F01DRAFT_215211 [Mycena amicta]
MKPSAVTQLDARFQACVDDGGSGSGCYILQSASLSQLSASASASASELDSDSLPTDPPPVPIPNANATSGTESHFAVVALATVLGLILVALCVFFVGRRMGVGMFFAGGDHDPRGRQRARIKRVAIAGMRVAEAREVKDVPSEADTQGARTNRNSDPPAYELDAGPRRLLGHV